MVNLSRLNQNALRKVLVKRFCLGMYFVGDETGANIHCFTLGKFLDVVDDKVYSFSENVWEFLNV